MRKPNLLFVMTDQQRWDAMSCASDWVRTPAIDRIAAEGVRFSECVTNSPLCVSARVSLATGLYPHNTGVWQNVRYDIAANTPTWMRAVRDAGYRTSLFGKTHLHTHGDLRDGVPLLRSLGLDDIDEITDARSIATRQCNLVSRWEEKGLLQSYRDEVHDRTQNDPYRAKASVLPLEDYLDTYVGEQAANYLSAYDRDEPWFCWVSFGGPHEPWDAPEPYASEYDPAAMPRALRRAVSLPSRPRGQLDTWWNDVRSPTPAQVAALRANYAGNVSLIDDQIANILRVIEHRGELDNTVIVFTSDHGEMNGDHGLVGKANLFESSVKVPLLIRTAETAQSAIGGTVASTPVELFDVGPTLVELAGGSLVHEQFARSLVPVLTDPRTPHRRFAVSEVLGEAMIRKDNWKVTVNSAGTPYLVFDLEADPGESLNLAGTPEVREVEAQMRNELLTHFLQAAPYLAPTSGPTYPAVSDLGTNVVTSSVRSNQTGDTVAIRH